MTSSIQLPDTGIPSMTSPSLDNTIGAAFIGTVVASLIFGFSSLQTYLYYHYWPKDTRIHRYSVGILLVLDALHLGLTVHAVYHYTITSFGQLPNLMHIVWSIKLQIAINVVIILFVQTLYAYRVYLLGGYHHSMLRVIVVGAVAGGFVIGIVLAYEIYGIDKFIELPSVAWAVDAALAASTSIDFVISAAMCYYLTRSKGCEHQLNSKISRVMQFTLSSGLSTSICSLSTLFTFIFLPNTMVFFALNSLLTKIYFASFLSMLNARQRPNDRSDTEASHNSSVSMPRFTRKPSRHTLNRSSASSSRKFLALSSPVEDSYGDPKTVSYSNASMYTDTPVSASEVEVFSSLPSPNPAQLPRHRTESSAQSPITPSRHSYMEKW